MTKSTISADDGAAQPHQQVQEQNARCRDLFVLYCALCCFRIINALSIQTQFDPDEYWQTLEPAYCLAFSDKTGSCAYTWEWTRRANVSAPNSLETFLERSRSGPVRSYAAVLPTFCFYLILRIFRIDSGWMVARGPLILHAVLVAAPVDASVWWIGTKVFKNHGNISDQRTRINHQKDSMDSNRAFLDPAKLSLLCCTTSWFHAYALTRTYSNSIETVLLLVGMALTVNRKPTAVENSVRNSTRINTGDCRHLFSVFIAFILGGISTAVRFTSLAAWIPLGIILSVQSPTIKDRIWFVLFFCAIPGAIGLTLATTVDRVLYGFWTIPLLGNLDFNVLQGMGSLYGTHPWHWYISAGLPAISGLLLPLMLHSLVSTMLSTRPEESVRNLWIVVASYTVLHSFSAHKEFRFLLPILPLLCLLAGRSLQRLLEPLTEERRHRGIVRLLLAVAVIPNLLAFLYLGVLHQQAPILAAQHIRNSVMTTARPLTSPVSVHYLMGCHSAPAYSHLHIPGVTMDVWSLDCSPDCRVNPTTVCESDQFGRDPVVFMKSIYATTGNLSNDGNDNNGESKSCILTEDQSHADNDSTEQSTCRVRTTPDFIVLFALEAYKTRGLLETMRMYEIGRFFQGINGATLLGSLGLGDDVPPDIFRQRPIVPGVVDLRLDEMIVFAKDKDKDYRESMNE